MINKTFVISCSLFLAALGGSMYFIFITWVLFELTADPFYTGVLVSLGFVPGLLLNLIIGVIVDRVDRKVLSVTALFVDTLVVGLLVISLLLESLTPWMILVIHMIMQLMGSLFRPSIQAFIAEIFKKNKLPKIYTQTNSASMTGGLIGSLLGGLIMGFLSEISAILIVFLCFCLASILLSLIKYQKRVNEIEMNKSTIVNDFIEGFSYLKKNKFLLGLFGIMFVGQLTLHNSTGFLSVYTIEYLKQTVTVYGFLDVALGIGGIIAGVFGTWWWNINKNHFPYRSLIIIFVGLICVGASPFLPISLLGIFLIGLGTTWLRVLLQSVQQIATEREFHGRMASYRMMCNQGSVVISGPIFGWIASAYGPNAIYICLLIPIGIAMMFTVKQERQSKFKEITKVSA